MEIEMLQHFEFNIFVPTSYYFLMRYLEVIGCVPKEAASFRASYYAEYSLQHHCMLLYKPSLVAAASIYLALKSERPDPWVENKLVEITCPAPSLHLSLLLFAGKSHCKLLRIQLGANYSMCTSNMPLHYVTCQNKKYAKISHSCEEKIQKTEIFMCSRRP